MNPAAILSVVVKAVGVKATTAELMDVQRVAGKAAAGTDAAAGRMVAASGKMKEAGHTMTHHLTLPLAAIGGAAGFMAVQFQESMDKIVGLVGVSKKQVDAWSVDILAMSKSVGKSPKELADAMFFVTSAGLRGKDALNALEASARASAAGLGETKVIADAVTSAMNAYGSKTVSAKKATDILTGAVKEGKVEASALAPTLGRVIPIAQSMGVSFDQVGASMASMTRLGFDAAGAATATRAILMTMEKPAKHTTDALGKMGMSIDGVRKSLKERGMLTTLLDLKKHAKANGVELSTLFPNVRALAGVLALTGKNAGANVGIFKRMADTTGVADKAFKSASDTTRLKMAKSLAGLQASAIAVGDVLLPIFNKVASGVASVATAFGNLSPSVKQVIVYAGLLLALLGPLLSLLGLIISPVGLLVAGLAALAYGFLYAYKHSKTFRDVLASIGGALTTAGGAIAAFGAGVVRWIGGAMRDAVHWVSAAVHTVVNEVRQWDTLGSYVGRVFGQIKAVARLLFDALKLIFRAGMLVLGPILVTAWTAIKDIFSGAFTEIKGVVQGGLDVLHGIILIVGGIFKGDFHQIWEGIKTIFHGGLTAVKGILSGAWQILKAPVDAIAAGLHDAFHNTWERIKSVFSSGINVAIDFLNVMIKAINALPFIKDIKPIAHVGGGGGGGSSGGGHGGPHGTGKLARGGAFGRTGGVVDRPITLMGEEAPLHAEYVVPTNPAYKTRAHSLISQAMKATGYATGGILQFAQGGKWNVQEMSDLWRSKGGNASIADTMGVIGLTESGGDPNAENPSGATGLWQILGQMVPGNLRNPGVNALNAIAKYAAQGLHAWDASRPKWSKLIGKTVSLGLDPMSLLPDLGSLPKWLEPMGKGLLGKAKAFISHAVSSINPFGGGGGTAGGPSGLGSFDGFQVAKWIIPVLQWARGHGWTGHVTSGYRSHAHNVAQGRNYGSNHEGIAYPGGAIDVGGYGAKAQGAALAAVLRGYHGARNLVWGGPAIGDWGHFSATGHKTGGTFGGAPYVGAYEKGGVVPQTGMALVHKGETITPAEDVFGVVAAFGKGGKHHHAAHHHKAPPKPPTYDQKVQREAAPLKAALAMAKLTGSPDDDLPPLKELRALYRTALAHAQGDNDSVLIKKYAGALHSVNNQIDRIMKKAKAKPKVHKNPNLPYDDNIQGWLNNLDAMLSLAKMTPDTGDDLTILGGEEGLYKKGLAAAKRHGDLAGMKTYAEGLSRVQGDIANLKPAQDADITAGIAHAQAALAVAKLTPDDKGKQLEALKTIQGLDQQGLSAAQARGDDAAVSSYANDLGNVNTEIAALTTAVQDQIAAMQAHTDALNAVKAELKSQTDLAKQINSTSAFQQTKYLADIMSGQFGRGIVSRSYGPGTGVEKVY